MLWLETTSPDLEKQVKDGAIAVMVVGSIEIHGPHLPVGTDTLVTQALVERATERERAVVLPPLPFAYVPENRHFPGTLTLSPRALLDILGEIADEVGRNGFEKLLLVNGHGGNNAILNAFVMSRSSKRKPIVYAYLSPWEIPRDVELRVTEGLETGHACVIETSRALALFEGLVKLEAVDHPARTSADGLPKGVISPYWWQAKALELYLGDPRLATAEKGKVLNDIMVENIVRAIRSVKDDSITPKVADDFAKRAFRYVPQA
jgi:creatinine amidohydrolase